MVSVIVKMCTSCPNTNQSTVQEVGRRGGGYNQGQGKMIRKRDVMVLGELKPFGAGCYLEN